MYYLLNIFKDIPMLFYLTTYYLHTFQNIGRSQVERKCLKEHTYIDVVRCISYNYINISKLSIFLMEKLMNLREVGIRLDVFASSSVGIVNNVNLINISLSSLYLHTSMLTCPSTVLLQVRLIHKRYQFTDETL